MELIINVLRRSTNNDERKEADARLRVLQEEQPQVFLAYAAEKISSAQNPTEERFFMATVLLSFVEQSWHSWSEKTAKVAIIQEYTKLLLTECFSAEPLCRKLGTVVALMAKLGPKAQEPGALPPHIALVADAYLAALRQLPPSPSAEQYAQVTQVLLLLHLLLKEVQTKRVGNVFEKLCQYVAPTLSVTLAVTPFGSVKTMEEYKFALRGLKCAYRVFGCGMFDPQFSVYILEQAWGLSTLLGSNDAMADAYIRLMDYAVKALQKVVVYFPTQLHHLTTEFFIPADPSEVGSAKDRSLLHFLYAIIMAGRGTRGSASEKEGVVISEKSACRAMSIISISLTAEDADAFVQEYLRLFTSSSLLPSLMEAIIVSFLSDDCSAETLTLWQSNPERALEDLDMEYDDENSTISCAEQLFLALTGSTTNASQCLSAAWSTVTSLLDHGSEADITAALHAIGIGYYTMSNTSGYLEFLEKKLLPILWNAIQSAGSGSTSVFVLRRVVWLIGMWCESVPDVAARAVVHNALTGALNGCNNVVIGLTALRAVENFVSDDHFTVQELSAEGLQMVLNGVQAVLPLLQSPTVVKQLVGLLYVLMEKQVLPSPAGDAVVALLLPVVQGFIARYLEAFHRREAGGESALKDDVDDEGEVDGLDTALLGTFLECLTGAVKICSGGEYMWTALYPIVLSCTNPDGVLAPWVEEEAWELLVEMGRVSVSYTALTEEALCWCLRHTDRDFVALHTVFSCAATLLLSRERAIEDLCSDAHLTEWMQRYAVLSSKEVGGATLSFLLTVVLRSQGPLRRLISIRSLEVLAEWTEDVQASAQPLQLALLFAVGLRDPEQADDLLSLLGSAVSATMTESGSLLEKLLLLLDVSPNKAYDVALYSILAASQARGFVPPQDADAVQYALEQRKPTSVDDIPNGGVDDGNETEEEKRENALLDVTFNYDVRTESLHYRRLVAAFSPLLF